MFGQVPLAQLEGAYCPDHKVVDLSYVTYQKKKEEVGMLPFPFRAYWQYEFVYSLAFGH